MKEIERAIEREREREIVYVICLGIKISVDEDLSL